MAEAYWDMEWTLQQQGFDYCYDKRLYDRIIEGAASGIRAHLPRTSDYQEPAAAVSREPRRAADRRAPGSAGGARRSRHDRDDPGDDLWHEGQFEGRRVRPPVFLQRRPDEEPDLVLAEWYRRLLAAVGGSSLRLGEWRLLEVEGWPDNRSCDNLLAWSWSEAESPSRHLVVVNWSGESSQGRVRPGWDDLRGRSVQLSDIVDATSFERDGTDLADAGLFVDLAPWAFHVLELH